MDLDDQLNNFTAATLASSGGTITVGRRRYAVGLYWQPSPSGRVSQAAREAARQPGQMADFFAVRPGNQAGRVPQFCLGQKELGHSAGLPSAAASVAEEQPGSWGGVFKVQEGWWLVISRDDLIAPDGDMLFEEEAPARQRLYDEMNLGGLQRIYAPEHWGIPNGDPMPLTLLMQGRAEARLQNVHLPIKMYMVVGGALIALMVVGYLLFMWQQQQEDARMSAMQQMTAEQQEIARLQAQGQLAPPPPPPPPKRLWEEQPLPEIWLDACRQAMTRVSRTAVGWTMEGASCGPKALTITWKRAEGPSVLPDAAIPAHDRRTAVSVFPLLELPPRGSEQLSPSGEMARNILAKDLPIEMTDLPEDASITPQPGQIAPPVPWLKKKITVTSQTAPWFIWQSYMGLTGIVLSEVRWDLNNWYVEGTLYEMR